MRPPQEETPSDVLVIVERDAACPLWMDHWGALPESWAMLEQEPEESGSAFSERFQQTLERFSAGTDVRATLIFVLGPGHTDAVMSERWTRSIELLRHLGRVRDGRLVLTTGYSPHPQEHPALTLLASELAEELHTAGVHLVVRPADTPRQSEVRAARPRQTGTTSADLVA